MSKQSSIEQVFAHIKASRNDTQYWNDSMLVDWLLEQEDRLKAMHKEEIVDAYNESFRLRDKPYSTAVKYYNETYNNENTDTTT